MTQAPATTIATAVRQHGGGRHPLNLPGTVQAGRLQDSRGGVINRRAEGATSSNTLPASCAAAAHPTTGVRRARELSPSLRSQNRPHAQLVEGYTRLERLGRFKEVVSTGDNLTAVDSDRCISITIRAFMRCIAKVATERAKATKRPQIQAYKLYVIQIGAVERAGRLVMELECFESREPIPSVNDDAPDLNQFVRCALNAFHEFSSYSQSDSSSLAFLHLGALRDTQLYVYCQEDSQDRTHGLYPRRQVRLSCAVVSQRGGNNPKRGGHPYRPPLPVDAQHHSLPSGDRKPWSLPALCHHVQQGAA
jgi:hypothetical protein